MDVQEALGGIGTPIFYTADDGASHPGGIATPSQSHGRGRVWDIRRKDIHAVGGLRHGKTLALWFGGIHNIAIPAEMMDVMNPEEIAAVYVGAQLRKRGNVHHHGPESIHDVMRAINDMGFPLIGSYAGWTELFSSAPGSQKTRISTLPDSVKEGFMESYMKPYRSSYVEAFPEGGDYHDPISIALHEGDIWHYLNRRWSERQ